MIDKNAHMMLHGIHYSDVNSSSTPLASGETFTGVWEDVAAFADLVVSVSTDQNATYSIQYSPDGVNQDSTLTRYYKTYEINVPHRFINARRFARIVFTNDSGTDQTYFRLQTSFGSRGPLNVPLDGTIATDYDATTVRPTNYHYEVAQGLRQGHRTFNKFGYNADVDAASEETIWPPGGMYDPPTTARTLDIVSSSTNDVNLTGTGAWNVYITGIDANRKYQTEVVNLDGQSTVTTTTTWLGINRVATGFHGALQQNDGNITITQTTDGRTMAYVPAGEGTTQQCIYHNELQASAMMDWLFINIDKSSGGGNPKVTVYARVYSPISNGNYEVFRVLLDSATVTTFEIRPSQPFVLGVGDVITLSATTSANNTIVNSRFSLIGIQNNDYDRNA